ncbi:hypothetical protein ACRALDRAFT_1078933 [Sodiomyces alcalophilus JCM 7366]|uniref:uncharacterized protein n=1 Tax=Sodiomyces alcalophilus JCM 7366 TaxID=591952 RepID=UPI0039B3AE53
MVQTRSRQRDRAKGSAGNAQQKEETGASPSRKRKADQNGTNTHQDDSPSKQARRANGEKRPKTEERDAKPLLARVLTEYGGRPLNGLIDEEKTPASNVVMAHILNALLSSARISHDIAMSTLQCLIEEDYHDLNVLKETSWEQRTEILTKGGYAHYRDKTANFLGNLVELMEEKYDNDASNMLPRDKREDEARKALRERVQEVKGIGQVGSDIFLGSIQNFFPNVAPFLDNRSRKTAHNIGLGDDLDDIFKAVGSDVARMAELEVALTKIRLDKREAKFTT